MQVRWASERPVRWERSSIDGRTFERRLFRSMHCTVKVSGEHFASLRREGRKRGESWAKACHSSRLDSWFMQIASNALPQRRKVLTPCCVNAMKCDFVFLLRWRRHWLICDRWPVLPVHLSFVWWQWDPTAWTTAAWARSPNASPREVHAWIYQLSVTIKL